MTESRKNGSWTPRPGFKHPAFVDMSGQTLAGVTVLSRAPNVNGNARWRVEHVACGHVSVRQGIELRDIAKQGRTVRCVECDPKRGKNMVRR